jgi:ABC-type amino acid transport system permease subunit
MPTNISTKSVIKATLNANQTAIKASLRNLGVTLGIAFVSILVAAILAVDGIIALIAGTVIFFVDRRRDKHHPQTPHHLGAVG